MDTLEEFKAVCRDDPGSVFVWGQAQKDASRLFDLNTDSELLTFIGSGDGLQRVRALSKPPFRDRQGNDTGIIVHPYRFSSNHAQMYLAFFYNPNVPKWSLKSFHEPNDPEPTLGDQLAQAIRQKQLEEDS